jgi:hypothetical protein
MTNDKLRHSVDFIKSENEKDVCPLSEACPPFFNLLCPETD